MIKLSEAIRLGAMLRPQALGAFLDHLGRSCVLGAAIEAIGVPLRQHDAWRIVKEVKRTAAFKSWAKLFGSAAHSCPACPASPSGNITDTMIHLNNDHRWTRECIADWVETIEAQQEQAAAHVAKAVSTRVER